MAKTLDDYLKEITTLAGGRDLSTAWFRDKIRQIVPKRIAEGQMRSMIRAGDHSTRPIYGIMNLYYYMPKYEETLPYYDVFPLVIPIKRLPGGFLGLNFHYLSVPMRINLLERLEAYENSGTLYSLDAGDIDQLLAFEWGEIKGMRGIKPTVHRYLAKYVYSNFLKIELEDIANKVRTRIHEITQNTHFGEELKNHNYQKNQMMLDVVNQAIKEYGQQQMSADPET